MDFTVQTDKGDKSLSLLFLTVARRNWKSVFVLTSLGIILFISPWGSSNNSSFLRYAKGTNVALQPPELRPGFTEWHSLTREQMKDQYLHCGTDEERPIHSSDTWIGMREAYISVVGKDVATVEVDASRTFETAFQVPFEVRQSPRKGRGIFAMKDIRKSEILYDFSQSAQFKKGSEFAEFLRIIRPDLACDVLMWSYVQYFGHSPIFAPSEDYLAESRIITDLDPGSFCNDGGKKHTNMAWLNDKQRLAKEGEHPTHPNVIRKDGSVLGGTVKSAALVAVRNVKKGEELLCWYGSFSEGLGLMID